MTPILADLGDEFTDNIKLAIDYLHDVIDYLEAADEARDEMYATYGVLVADHGEADKACGLIESLRRHLV